MTCPRCGDRHLLPCGPTSSSAVDSIPHPNSGPGSPRGHGAGSKSAEASLTRIDAVLGASDESAADLGRDHTGSHRDASSHSDSQSAQAHSSALCESDLMPLWLIHDISDGRVASVTTDDVQRLARTTLFFAQQANPHNPTEAKENQ